MTLVCAAVFRRTDARGLHKLCCKFSAGRHTRHAALNNAIKRVLQFTLNDIIKWGLQFYSLEPVRVNTGDCKRCDGITLFPFSNEISLC